MKSGEQQVDARTGAEGPGVREDVDVARADGGDVRARGPVAEEGDDGAVAPVARADLDEDVGAERRGLVERELGVLDFLRAGVGEREGVEEPLVERLASGGEQAVGRRGGAAEDEQDGRRPPAGARDGGCDAPRGLAGDLVHRLEPDASRRFGAEPDGELVDALVEVGERGVADGEVAEAALLENFVQVRGEHRLGEDREVGLRGGEGFQVEPAGVGDDREVRDRRWEVGERGARDKVAAEAEHAERLGQPGIERDDPRRLRDDRASGRDGLPDGAFARRRCRRGGARGTLADLHERHGGEQRRHERGQEDRTVLHARFDAGGPAGGRAVQRMERAFSSGMKMSIFSERAGATPSRPMRAVWRRMSPPKPLVTRPRIMRFEKS